MHIFLTGPKGIGKSTVILKSIELLEQSLHQTEGTFLNLGGFYTHSGLPEDRDIYISHAWLTKSYTLSNKIATRNGIVPTVHEEVFENLGVDILKKSKDAQLIIMDELGFLEQNATTFQKAVLKCLGRNTPILGTLRQGEVPWLDQIKILDKVKVLEVSLHNRDDLPATIAATVRLSIKLLTERTI